MPLSAVCLSSVCCIMKRSISTDCDNNIQHGGSLANLTDCNMACTGNPAESCGAGNRLNLFWNGKTPPPLPGPVESGLPSPWKYAGCYV